MSATKSIYVHDIPHLCLNAKLLLQENDLLQMERTVLTSLEFRMMPTAYTFWSVYRMGYTMHNPSASLASYYMVRTQNYGSIRLLIPSKVMHIVHDLHSFNPL